MSFVRSIVRRGSLARTLLSAFLLLVLIPIFCINAVHIWRQYENSRAQVVAQLTSVVTLKKHEVETWFTSLPIDLELLVANPSVSANISELLVSEHNEFVLAGWREILIDTITVAQASGHKFDEVFLIDTTGKVVVATNRASEGASLSDQEFFQKGLSTSYVQSPSPSRLYNGSVVVFAATPVRDQKGMVRGVLAGVAGMHTLNAIMQERAGLGQTGETYLVGADSYMLTAPRRGSIGVSRFVDTQGARAALRGENGYGLYANYQQPAVAVLGVYRWLPEMQAALLAEQSQAEAFATTFQNLWLSLSLTFVTLLIAIGAAIMVTRSIATPLEHLTFAATRVAGGDLTQTAFIQREDEIGTLGNAFNAMTIQLRELIEGLEERVAARTSELEAQTEALRQSEQRLSLHVQQTPLAAIEWNLDFEVEAWNPGAERIFGYSRDEAIGRYTADLIVPECGRQRVNQDWIDLLARQGARHDIYENITKDGRKIACEWYSTPLVNQDGRIIGAASLIEDITERKRFEEAEHEQRALAEALRDTAAALNSTLDLDQVLDNILANVERVVQHDAASIMLVDEENTVRVVRYKGNIPEEKTAQTRSRSFPIASVPYLHGMADTGQPVIVSNTTSAPDWEEDRNAPWVRSYAGMPIQVRGTVVGFINLESATPGFFSPAHTERLRSFADQAAIAVTNAWLVDELRQANDRLRLQLKEIRALQVELHEQAIRDPLTGLYNRRFLQEALAREISRGNRAGLPIGIIIMDIDHFKTVNDTFGHTAGDVILQTLGTLLKSSCRMEDIACRYGGEEFVIVLPGASLEATYERAELIRARFDAIRTIYEEFTVHTTLSLGVAAYPLHGLNAEEVLIYADRALYRAKQDGRNRVVTYQDEIQTPPPQKA